MLFTGQLVLPQEKSPFQFDARSIDHAIYRAAKTAMKVKHENGCGVVRIVLSNNGEQIADIRTSLALSQSVWVDDIQKTICELLEKSNR